jgi:hypothetical protein
LKYGWTDDLINLEITDLINMEDTVSPVIAEYIKFLIGIINGSTIVSPEMLFTDDYTWMRYVIKEILDNSSAVEQFYERSLESPSYNPDTGALVLKGWDNQSTLILGCGHDFCGLHHHDSSTEYLIDIDLTMLPDLCLKTCHQSLAKALPEARGKIRTIVFEGWCGNETQVFFDDCLFLLDEGGFVVSGDGDKHRVVKRDGKLYFVKFDADGTEESSVEYHPWTDDDVINGTFGFDIHDWKNNMIMNGKRIAQLNKERVTKEEIIAFIESNRLFHYPLETAR